MLQDVTPPLQLGSGSCALDTQRLTLRRPTLADARTIARLANHRCIAENARRLPYPYLPDHAVAFVQTMAERRDDAFLIEHDFAVIGMVGISVSEPDPPELGCWLGVEHWGQGFATEAVRAAIDYYFSEFEFDQLHAGARVTNPASRNVLEKCGFQWSGVKLHRFEALGSSTPVDCFRLSRGVWSSLKTWANAAKREP